jgi:hypothetical protein
LTTKKSQSPIKQFVTNQAKTHTKQRDKSPGRKPMISVEFCPLKGEWDGQPKTEMGIFIMNVIGFEIPFFITQTNVGYS